MLGLLHPLAGTPLKAHHDFVCHLSHGAQEPAPKFLRCVAHVYSSFSQLPLGGSQSISKIHDILHGEKLQWSSLSSYCSSHTVERAGCLPWSLFWGELLEAAFPNPEQR